MVVVRVWHGSVCLCEAHCTRSWWVLLPGALVLAAMEALLVWVVPALVPVALLGAVALVAVANGVIMMVAVGASVMMVAVMLVIMVPMIVELLALVSSFEECGQAREPPARWLGAVVLVAV